MYYVIETNNERGILMKKTVKKVISMALVMLMLASVCGIQTFAIFDIFNKVTVTDIAISDTGCTFVSMKELQLCFDENLEYIAEIEEAYGIPFEEVLEALRDEGDEFLLNAYQNLTDVYLGYLDFEYRYTITLSNGEVVTTSSYENTIEANNLTDITVECYVSYDDYLEAKENNADKIKINFIATEYNSLKNEFVEIFSKQDEIDAVPCVVKSLKPVSGVPSKIYDTYDYIDLEGAKFKIKYADGTTKTETVVQEIVTDDDGFVYVEHTLDGSPLYAYEDYDFDTGESSLTFSFLDEIYTKEITVRSAPFKSIKINDCVYDTENGLQSVTYTIKWKNGDTKKYTKEIDNVKEADTYFVIDCVSSHFVYVETVLASEDWYNDYDETDGEKLRVYVSIGEKVSNPAEFDAPEQASEGILAKLMSLITGIIDMFKNIISSFFGG